MNRRRVLIGAASLAVAGVAGCSDDSEEEPTPDPTDWGTPTATDGPPPTESRTASGTATPEAVEPAAWALSIDTEGEYGGDAVPRGATLVVSFAYDSWSHDGVAAGRFHITTVRDGRELDEHVEAFETDTGVHGLVKGTYETTIDTAGYPAGDVGVSVVVEDGIGGMQSRPTEAVVTVAEYTRTDYDRVARSLGEIRDQIDRGVESYEQQGDGSILGVRPNREFDADAVTGPTGEARNVASDHLQRGVEPFRPRLERLRAIATTVWDLAERQEEFRAAYVATFEVVRRLAAEDSAGIERRTATASDAVEAIRLDWIHHDEALEFPVDVPSKVAQFDAEYEVLSALVEYSAGLVDPVRTLERARSAYDAGNYDAAEADAAEASGALDDARSSLGDYGTLENLVLDFAVTTENVRNAAAQLRDEAARSGD